MAGKKSKSKPKEQASHHPIDDMTDEEFYAELKKILLELDGAEQAPVSTPVQAPVQESGPAVLTDEEKEIFKKWADQVSPTSYLKYAADVLFIALSAITGAHLINANINPEDTPVMSTDPALGVEFWKKIRKMGERWDAASESKLHALEKRTWMATRLILSGLTLIPKVAVASFSADFTLLGAMGLGVASAGMAIGGSFLWAAAAGLEAVYHLRQASKAKDKQTAPDLLEDRIKKYEVLDARVSALDSRLKEIDKELGRIRKIPTPQDPSATKKSDLSSVKALEAEQTSLKDQNTEYGHGKIKLLNEIEALAYSTEIGIQGSKKSQYTKEALVEKSKKILRDNQREDNLQGKQVTKKESYKVITQNLIQKEVQKEQGHRHKAKMSFLVGLGALTGGLALVIPPAAIVFGAISALCFAVAGVMKGVEIYQGVQQDRLIKSALISESEKLAVTDEKVRHSFDNLKDKQKELVLLDERPQKMSRSQWSHYKKEAEKEVKKAEQELKELVVDGVVKKN